MLFVRDYLKSFRNPIIGYRRMFIVYSHIVRRIIKSSVTSGIKYPSFITMFITSKCARLSSCKHCWRPEASLSPKEMDMSIIYRIAKEHIPVILVSGGEPTEHTKFIKIISILEQSGADVYILTNGDNYNSLIRAISRKETTKVIIGINPLDSDEILRTKRHTLEMLQSNGIMVYLNLTVWCDNVDLSFLQHLNETGLLLEANRIQISKYIIDDCEISASEFCTMWEYCKILSADYNCKNIVVTSPYRTITLVACRFLSFLIGKQFDKCSGYPLRAMIDENGSIRNCLKKKDGEYEI